MLKNKKNQMKIFPALDIMGGKVVRLYKGKRSEKKVYGDPLPIAQRYENFVDKIHIVDLDGAFKGSPENLSIIKRIIGKTSLDVQYGGGLRTYESIENVYALGVDNVIIGTKAFDLEFLRTITNEFEGITVSLDVKNDHVAVEGWQEMTSLEVTQAYEVLRPYVSRFIYTSVLQDGTLTGIKETETFWGDADKFIYAGGVSTIEDIQKLIKTNFFGVVIGKAILEATLKLRKITNIF